MGAIIEIGLFGPLISLKQRSCNKSEGILTKRNVLKEFNRKSCTLIGLGIQRISCWVFSPPHSTPFIS